MNNDSKLLACMIVSLLGPWALGTAGAAAAGSRDCERKAEALLGQMTLDEKIGQMAQADMNAIKDQADIQKYCLGSMLSGGDSNPAGHLPARLAQGLPRVPGSGRSKTRLKIPLLYGIDAVHGHNNVERRRDFPA